MATVANSLGNGIASGRSVPPRSKTAGRMTWATTGN